MQIQNPTQYGEMIWYESPGGDDEKNLLKNLETFNVLKNLEALNLLKIENIEEGVDFWLDKKVEDFVVETKKFCIDLSRKFQKRFSELIDEYQEKDSKLSNEIVDYLQQMKLDIPKFIIANKAKAKYLLNDFDIDVKIKEDSLLLVFNLPKQLAQYWRKGWVDI